MKAAKELCMIAGIAFIGECMNRALPLPIPAGIYGICLMFFALQSGILKLKHIESGSGVLLDMMPVLFVPAGVGLINQTEALRRYMIPVILVLFFTTAAVMAVTGKMMQYLRMRKGEKRDAEFTP